MAKSSIMLTSSLALLACAGAATAAPAWDIRKPPIAGPTNTGPVIDPPASQGQWFRDRDGATQTALPFEFYDNISGNGGGFASHRAIDGRLTAFSSFSDATGARFLTGYALNVTITNDLGTETGIPAGGTNLHGESSGPAPYVGIMRDTKLTIHWANELLHNFIPGGPNIGPASNVFALNHDALAWYSFTGTGDYQVPTWNFGDILPGQSVTRTLDFSLRVPIPLASVTIPQFDDDLLIARTNDLKIGQFFQSDPFTAGFRDDGSAYPFGGDIPTPFSSFANSSVFFVPSPAATGMLALAGVFASRRRRQG